MEQIEADADTNPDGRMDRWTEGWQTNKQRDRSTDKRGRHSETGRHIRCSSNSCRERNVNCEQCAQCYLMTRLPRLELCIIFLGVAPPSVLFIQAGTTLYKLTTTGDITSWKSILFLAVAAIVSLLPVVFKKAMRKKLEWSIYYLIANQMIWPRP